MIHWWTRLANMLQTSFDKWEAAHRKKVKGKNRPEQSGSGPGNVPLTVEAKGPQSPTGGMDSFASMMRHERGVGYRAPSVVGSVRSFRSIQTTEEQLGSLESRMERTEQAQQDMNAKLDQILNMLSQGKTAAGMSGPGPIPKR